MYPNTYFSLFPAFPRKPRAFVAMSFLASFQPRWERVLSPGLKAIHVGEVPLDPFRVDLSKVSDSILTEILQGIGDSTVIVADMTAVGEHEGRPIRNSNVMYEVGLAHATRLPEEVVLFRSDRETLDFDIAGVRVHSYDPDADVDNAREQVTATVVESLNSLNQRRRLVLRSAAQQLTQPALALLIEVTATGTVLHPQNRTMRDALGGVQRADAISLLLELGAIRANLMRLTPATVTRLEVDSTFDSTLLDYTPTPLGKALFQYISDEMGLSDPELQALLQEALDVKTDPADGAA